MFRSPHVWGPGSTASIAIDQSLNRYRPLMELRTAVLGAPADSSDISLTSIMSSEVYHTIRRHAGFIVTKIARMGQRNVTMLWACEFLYR